LTRIRVESWQGMATAQRLQGLGLPVEVFSPTPRAHADEWPQLAHALATSRLVLPPHAQLREELLGLVVEVGPTRAKVVDRGRVHQDHAVAVRGVVASLLATSDNHPLASGPPHENPLRLQLAALEALNE